MLLGFKLLLFLPLYGVAGAAVDANAVAALPEEAVEKLNSNDPIGKLLLKEKDFAGFFDDIPGTDPPTYMPPNYRPTERVKCMLSEQLDDVALSIVETMQLMKSLMKRSRPYRDGLRASVITSDQIIELFQAMEKAAYSFASSSDSEETFQKFMHTTSIEQ